MDDTGGIVSAGKMTAGYMLPFHPKIILFRYLEGLILIYSSTMFIDCCHYVHSFGLEIPHLCWIKRISLYSTSRSRNL